MVLTWNERVVNEAEEEYSRLQVAPAQTQIVVLMADLLCSFIPLKKLAMKGFAWRAIIKWQKDNHRPLTDLETIPPAQRLSAAKDIFANLEASLKAVLHNKERESIISEAMSKAMKFYKENAANR